MANRTLPFNNLILCSMLFLIHASIFAKDPSRDSFKELFNSLIITKDPLFPTGTGPFLGNSNIERKKLVDIIPIDKWNNPIYQDMESFYDNGNDYALKHDFDKDGIHEIVLLQIEGSGQYPYFSVYKYDDQLKKYQSIIGFAKLIYPIRIKKNLYFFEKDYDANSGRLRNINLLKISKKLKLKNLYTFTVKYHYDIPVEFRNFLNNEILEKGSRFDFSYLKQDELIKTDKYDFAYKYQDFIIKIKIDHTSVGHLNSCINLSLINKKEGYSLLFDGLWGFNFLKENNHYVLVLTQFNNVQAHTTMLARKFILSNLENSNFAVLIPKMIIE